MTLEAEPVSPGEALSGKLSGKLTNYNLFEQIVTNNFFHVSPGLRKITTGKRREFRNGKS